MHANYMSTLLKLRNPLNSTSFEKMYYSYIEVNHTILCITGLTSGNVFFFNLQLLTLRKQSW